MSHSVMTGQGVSEGVRAFGFRRRRLAERPPWNLRDGAVSGWPSGLRVSAKLAKRWIAPSWRNRMLGPPVGGLALCEANRNQDRAVSSHRDVPPRGNGSAAATRAAKEGDSADVDGDRHR